jgi:hypothetical protein
MGVKFALGERFVMRTILFCIFGMFIALSAACADDDIQDLQTESDVASINFLSELSENVRVVLDGSVLRNTSGGEILEPGVLSSYEVPAGQRLLSFVNTAGTTIASMAAPYNFEKDGVYTLNISASAPPIIKPTVSTPVISPASGNIPPHVTSVRVSITCATPFASIWYTTDGTVPDGLNGTPYAGEFDLPLDEETIVIKATGHRETFTVSAIAISTITRTNEAGDIFIEQPNSTLQVNNASAENLVLYSASGSSGAGTLLGGVEAGRSNWGVPNAPQGLYVLNIVRYSDYQASHEDPRIASSLLVYVDNTPASYEISFGAAGSVEFKVQNNTAHFVEILKSNFAGQIFAIVRPYESGSRFAAEGDYYLFPIFKIPLKNAQGGIIGLHSKNHVNGIMMRSIDKDIPSTPLTVEAADINAPIESLISIHNNWGRNAMVLSGSNPAGGIIVESTLGRRIVNAGNTSPFVISRQPAYNANGQPAQTSFEVQIFLEAFAAHSDVFTKTVEIGKMYTIICNVDGSWTEMEEQTL